MTFGMRERERKKVGGGVVEWGDGVVEGGDGVVEGGDGVVVGRGRTSTVNAYNNT